MYRCTLRFVALLALGLLPACLQIIDPTAASGSGGGGGDDQPDTDLETPPIELPSGDTTTSACDALSQGAMDILDTTCASCHGGGSAGAEQGQPPFGYVLDVNMMLTARSETVPDPTDPNLGMLFLDPGNPDASRVYVRIAAGEMPPAVPIGADPIPMPSVSDESVLYSWIMDCLPPQ